MKPTILAAALYFLSVPAFAQDATFPGLQRDCLQDACDALDRAEAEIAKAREAIRKARAEKGGGGKPAEGKPVKAYSRSCRTDQIAFATLAPEKYGEWTVFLPRESTGGWVLCLNDTRFIQFHGKPERVTEHDDGELVVETAVQISPSDTRKQSAVYYFTPDALTPEAMDDGMGRGDDRTGEAARMARYQVVMRVDHPTQVSFLKVYARGLDAEKARGATDGAVRRWMNDQARYPYSRFRSQIADYAASEVGSAKELPSEASITVYASAGREFSTLEDGQEIAASWQHGKGHRLVLSGGAAAVK